MVTPTAGAVVLVPFPFSDLSQAKLRPAIALADVGRDDWILCQITSVPYGDPRAIALADDDFATGSLHIAKLCPPQQVIHRPPALDGQSRRATEAQPFQNIVDAVIQIFRDSIKP